METRKTPKCDLLVNEMLKETLFMIRNRIKQDHSDEHPYAEQLCLEKLVKKLQDAV